MLATAGICGYRGDGHLKFAAGIEFMHTATLLHDDLVDESAMRRGKIAARMLWGNQTCVLVGDFLLGHAFKMMVEPGMIPPLSVVSQAAAVIAEGEILQLNAAKDTTTTEDAYMGVIRRKTAELFAAAAEVGVMLAGKPKADEAAARSYGMNLGIAFQLIDDALDYGGSSAKLGKNVGDDFREGKITLPVVLAFRRGSEKERDFWSGALEKGEIGDGDVKTLRPDEKAQGARRHDRAGDTLRRHRARRDGDFPASPGKVRCSRWSISVSDASLTPRRDKAPAALPAQPGRL